MQIATLCPRFERCAVNNCPLEPGYPALPVSPDDAQRRCTLSKSRRFAIGSGYPDRLALLGLTPREYSAMTNKREPSEAQRKTRADFAKKAAELRQLSLQK